MSNGEFKRSFTVTGMTCVSCARIVEKALSKIPAVKFASVNLATSSAFIIAEREISFEEIRKAVEDVGYGASEEPLEEIEARRYREAKRNLFLSWFLTTPLMLLMIYHMFFDHIKWFVLVESIVVPFILFTAGMGTIRGAWIALRHWHANMDTLISLGAISSWFTSLLNLFGLGVASFGTIGAMMITFHLTGRFIESHLRDRATREIKSLLKLKGKEATVLLDDREVLLPVEALKEGVLILVRPGERIPADGVIVEGRSSIDESFISGESIPISKGVGDEVIGGSLNLLGPLKIRVTKVGEESFLSQMIRLVEEAQGSKIPIQALADRITSFFVPLVFSLASISALFWLWKYDSLFPIVARLKTVFPWVITDLDSVSFAVFVFIATLVIACPCALGIATPMALAVGSGLLAKKGLLVRNAEAIQTSKDLNVLLVDKTGTLTLGSPIVVFHALDEETLKIAASIERASNHPLAKAISSLSSEDIALDDVTEIAGEGVVAHLKGDEFFVGRPKDYSSYEGYLEDGKTIVEVRKNGEVLGFVVVEDPIREDTPSAVSRFKEMGIKVVMVTGDNEKTAKAVAKRVGIEEVWAQVKPDGKLEIVRSYQAKKYRVAMVGDGMNDAPSLKGADIGIAMGSGVDLAIEGADVIIVKEGISRVLDLVEISRRTFKTIRQNLFWAFFYNLIAIPMAMMGLLHPLVAEIAMLLSSITVIANSLRIREVR
ncbi:MAG: copper-translocating P-type ATPase [Synergistetes bacterium]|nr:copper-translocating P-type ATPase [Synergistota bacterium]